MLTICIVTIAKAFDAGMNAIGHSIIHSFMALVSPTVWRTGVCLDCLQRADAAPCGQCCHTVLIKRLSDHGCKGHY